MELTPTILAFFLLFVHVYAMSIRNSELEQVKRSILRALGITSVPDVSALNTTLDIDVENMFKKSAEYFEELYDDAEHQLTTYLYPKEWKKTERDEWFMYFNTSDKNISKERSTAVIEGRLNIHKTVKQPTLCDITTKITLKIYQKLTSRKDNSSQSDIMVDSVEILDPEQDDWMNFDISQTFSLWWHENQHNHGLRISCENCDICGVSLSSGDPPPRLDLQLKELSLREKRFARKLRRFGKRKKKMKSDCTTGFESKKCCRYHLWVSFKEIGWDSWIVSPDGFDAYYCKGKCSGRFKPANTHTLVQTAMRKKANVTLPKPCCVPKKLTPLSLYHYDNSNPPQLVLTTHKGMIVKSCACS